MRENSLVIDEIGVSGMIKDIVVNLSSEEMATFAVSTASEFHAHLAGISFLYEPIVLPVSDMGGIPFDYIEAQRSENEKRATDAKAQFNESARCAGLSSESSMINAEVAEAGSIFGRIARRFDLAVVSQTGPDKRLADDLIIEAALFESGRPVLVVPYIQKAGLRLNRVMLCWNGSSNAARAASDAMPFLAKAKKVDVVTIIGEKGKDDEIAGADIAEHLARHGLNIELRLTSAGHIDVADNILSLAADISADLIVMGGYGHSRLREFVLGGATRGVLSSMTIPL